MTIFHISGSSGAGKSFAGDVLSRIYDNKKLHVIDLDKLFRAAMDRTHEANAAEQSNKILQFVQNYIEGKKRKHQNLLLVGYSDLIIDQNIKYFDLGADVKYFIDLPVAQLIQQYRSRASDHILHTRREVQTLSDDAIRKMAVTDRKLYRGFRALPQLMIIKDIILRLGK